MIILGIDPGLATTGYGFLRKEKDTLQVLEYGIISTPPDADPGSRTSPGSVHYRAGFSSRLKMISDDLRQLIKKHSPQFLAVEKLFFCKNVKTALDVGHARGIILLEGMNANLELHEFTPLQVKQAITGYGSADKQQMQKMVQQILKLKELPRPDDAADALALAITLANSINSLGVISNK